MSRIILRTRDGEGIRPALRLLSIEVQGREGQRYGFDFYQDPGFIPEWRAAGLDVTEIINTIPEWFPWPRAWVFVQDVLNFRNPWHYRAPPSICPRCRWFAPGRCSRFGWTPENDPARLPETPYAPRCRAFEATPGRNK